MIPKEQIVELYYKPGNPKSLGSTCREYIAKGWIIHQISKDNDQLYYIILYKY